MSTSPIPWDQFAKSVRDKYPGAYDHLSDSQLVGKVVAKYPQYKDNLANYQSTQFEKDRPGDRGVLGAVVDKGKDALEAIKNSPGPTGGRSLLDPKAWYNADEANFSPSSSPIVQQATRPIPADTPTQVLGGQGPGSQAIGRGIYRAATTLSPLVPGLNPQASEAQAAKGNTSGVGLEAAIPLGLAVAGAALPGAAKAFGDAGGLRGTARSLLLDPVTGEPTLTPHSIAKRLLRNPEEVSEARGSVRGGGSFQGSSDDPYGKVLTVPEPNTALAPVNENYMASVPRTKLFGLAESRTPGAATQLQQLGNKVLFKPEGMTGLRRSVTRFDEFGRPIEDSPAATQ